MLDTTTTRRTAQSTAAVQQQPAERLVVEQIMQPFMGNRDWAQLIAPRTMATEAPAEAEEVPSMAPGVVAAAADESWLPGAGHATTAFLSGLW